LTSSIIGVLLEGIEEPFLSAILLGQGFDDDLIDRVSCDYRVHYYRLLLPLPPDPLDELLSIFEVPGEGGFDDGGSSTLKIETM
jgi:hypothetical protein